MNSVMKAWADMPPVFADRLMALLTAPGRVTHGLHYVNQLLLDADDTCHPHWLKPLRWAIPYHAAVHDPLAPPGANEGASAELWLEHFPAIHETVHGVSARWGQDIATAIMETANPFARSSDLLPWQHALLDLNLGWLGLPAPLYDANRILSAAAHEAAGIDRADWARERRAFLERAIACPRLFHRIHIDREAAARANVRNELAHLPPATP